MSTLLLKNNRPTAIDKYPVRVSTGVAFVGISHSDRFLNSSIYCDDSTAIILQENKQDDNLIKLKEKFNSELPKFKEVPEYRAVESFNSSVSYLTRIEPEKMSVEVTDDDSLYFSLIKGNYTIYLEEYVDDGEVIVTMFKNGAKQNSISGSIDYVASKLQEVISY